MNQNVMNRVKEHYEFLKTKKFEIVFLALQGSQNYGLDIYDENYKSDVDTKAIVLPSFSDFVHDKNPQSNTIILSNNEHIDVKDIRTMFETYKKQNINYIETLFSEYLIINPKYAELVKPLFDNNELIAHLNYNQTLRCIAGMSMEKLKAMEHPYPTIIDKIEKYGYDPKQLHHIFRMNDFIRKYVSGKSYKECLFSKRSLYLKEIKKGILPVNEAVKLAQETDADTKNIKDKYLKERDEINQDAVDLLTNTKFNILKYRFREELI